MRAALPVNSSISREHIIRGLSDPGRSATVSSPENIVQPVNCRVGAHLPVDATDDDRSDTGAEANPAGPCRTSGFDDFDPRGRVESGINGIHCLLPGNMRHFLEASGFVFTASRGVDARNKVYFRSGAVWLPPQLYSQSTRARPLAFRRVPVLF
jgi:hypothetical protein